MVRIDLHVHTTRYSPCSRLNPETLISIAPDLPIQAVVITEHDIQWSAEEIEWAERSASGSIRFFRGVEVSTDVGHVLAYNLADHRRIGYGMPLEELTRIAHEDRAALVLAHPGRFGVGVPEPAIPPWTGISAVEAMSNNIHEPMREEVRRAASLLGSQTVAGSDAHDEEIVGLYATEFPRMPADEAELAEMIRTGAGSPWADIERVQALRAAHPDRPILLKDPA